MQSKTYRKNDALSSKWRKVNADCGKFNGIYNCIKSKPSSGWNEQNIFEAALKKYKDETNRSFSMIRAWQVLKDEQKWAGVPNEVERAKR
jgi:hypothetical protein